MKLEISKTNIITTVDQWLQFAPPMGKEKHWKDDRSAKSLAQFMTDKTQVKKLENVLKKLGYDIRGVISVITNDNKKSRLSTSKPLPVCSRGVPC